MFKAERYSRGMRPITLFMVVAFVILGAVAPGIWIYEFHQRYYIGSPDPILDRLVPFFPCSILLFAVASAVGFVGAGIIVIAFALDMALYALVGYIAFNIILVIKAIAFRIG